MKRAAVILVFVGLGMSSLFSAVCYGQSAYLQEGIDQYKLENYEEAVDILQKAREEAPDSAAAAFFLGLTYKQMLQYAKALPHMQAAVNLQPRIKEALVELIEILFRLGGKDNLEAAKEWITLAKNEEIFPAKVAFLEGMVLQKQGEHDAAIARFQHALDLDPAYAQAAEFQIALSLLKQRELKKARERLQAVILEDPQTDLAAFARRYQDLVERRIELEKPWRFTASVFGGYDSNVVLDPLDLTPAAAAALGPTDDEESGFLNGRFRVDYVPILKGKWLFNASYSLFGNLYQNHSTTHDSVINTLQVSPGYNFGRFALNLSVIYNHAMVKNPGYKKYMDTFAAGPLFRFLLKPNHIIEVSALYDVKEYNAEFNDSPSEDVDNDRDADGWRSYLGWIWTFKQTGFLNLRYEYAYEDTDGAYWENDTHRFAANLSYPLPKRLALQLSGQVYFQDYQNRQPVIGQSEPWIEREDDVQEGSIGLTWNFRKNTTIIMQFMKTRANSNIDIYEYEREIFQAGVEYRF